MTLPEAQLPETGTGQGRPSRQQDFHCFLSADHGLVGADRTGVFLGRELNRVVLLESEQVLTGDTQ